MKVLHICNDYCGSKVHMNLYSHLDHLLSKQTIYTYFDDKEQSVCHQFSGQHSNIIYDIILNPYLRKIYPLKMWWVIRHLKKKVNVEEYDCVHATTLLSDGGIAYRLFKKYRIPYIVAFRSSDLIIAQKYPKFFLFFSLPILLNAKNVIFVNKAIKANLRSLGILDKVWEDVENKSLICPNGIESYWLNNIYNKQRPKNHKICYVGNFYARKNVLRLISAVESLREDFPDICLEIVGGGGIDETKVHELASHENSDFIHLYGKISDKEKLSNVLRECAIFAMPSWGETFGLVYVEALTQNLRLLYSQGEGIDGMFENTGIAVDPFSIQSIADGLRKLFSDYDKFEDNTNIDFSVFDWNNIARGYMALYEKALI